MKQTPLHQWIHRHTEGDLAAWQLERLRETLALAATNPWYCRRLPPQIESLAELSRLPTMCPEDLSQKGMGLCCVSQREIQRITTLTTSGTTGEPKRVCASEEDQENTVDFFHHGLLTLVRPGDKMAILFPGTGSGGLSQLIGCALERLGAIPVIWGGISSLEKAGQMLSQQKVETIVGTPVPILALAKYTRAAGLKISVRAVLLSADYVPDILRSQLQALWNCQVYEHYGMTEMGFGGAVDCEAHQGLHIREKDLLFEILDEQGNAVTDGQWGEITVTTLTRKAMPLVRYRTGDVSRVLPGVCLCGSPVRRLAPPAGRRGGRIRLADGQTLWLPDWDEALLAQSGISNFRLMVSRDLNRVRLEIESQRSLPSPDLGAIAKIAGQLLQQKGACMEITVEQQADCLGLFSGRKRTIVVEEFP